MRKHRFTAIIRFIIQLVFLISLPGLMSTVFNQVGQLYDGFFSGNLSLSLIVLKCGTIFTITLITVIFGRFFCGWMCAFGSLNEFIYVTFKKIFKTKFTINSKTHSVLKYFKYIILVLIIYFIWTIKLFDLSTINPWDVYLNLLDFSYIMSTYPIALIILLISFIGAIFIERFFCRYLCPLGAILSLKSIFRPFYVYKPCTDCKSCSLCSRACPMKIDLSKTDKVKSIECINCFKCVDVCPRKNANFSIMTETINPVFVSTMVLVIFLGGTILINSKAYKHSTATIPNTSTQKATVEKAPEVTTDTTDTTVVPDTITDTSNQVIVDKSKVTTTKTEPNNTKLPETTTTQNKPTQNNATLSKPTPTTTDNNTVNTPTPTETQVSPSKPSTKYKDGTFTGVGRGYRPGLTVEVTIKNDKITNIQIVNHNETPSFTPEPFEIVPSEIISSQSTNVDTVSGATRSSIGIIQAVENALKFSAKLNV